jgi:phosphohistidine phosphatase
MASVADFWCVDPASSALQIRLDCYSHVKIVVPVGDFRNLEYAPAEPDSMNLYLMRHANAGLSRGNPVLDAKRALIKEGKEQCMLMARVLSALKAPVDVIVSSPLKRALQTAQFVGTELGYEAEVEISPALGLNADYAAFQQLLAKYAKYEGVLMVGHNPNLFQFLGRMITGNGGAAIRMRKGSIARVDMDRHPPLLRWLIDPRMARSIYASVAKSSRPKTSRK